MSLRATVARPFRQNGTDSLPRSEFVVALTLEAEWFTPEEVEQLLAVAGEAELVEEHDDTVVATFDPGAVDVPDGFTPDASVLEQQTVFERTLESFVAAGHDKQSAVGSINAVQADLGVTIEAAAVVAASRAGLEIDDLTPLARTAVRTDGGDQ